MTVEERAAELYELVHTVGFRCLLMGGHAVRYYGLDRRTVDFDFQVAVEPHEWVELARRLKESGALSTVIEGPTFRPDDFRRFVIGRLPDGREERLEFWRANHLLPPFSAAWQRREEGSYGGHIISFLGLDDLIRSKETERDDDWNDVRILEEIADERRLMKIGEANQLVAALARLRSRRGFELALSRGLLDDKRAVADAAARATHLVTRAFLAPYASIVPDSDDLLWRALASVQAGSGKHLALVEACRNRCRAEAAAADRADKERIIQSRRT